MEDDFDFESLGGDGGTIRFAELDEGYDQAELVVRVHGPDGVERFTIPFDLPEPQGDGEEG